MGKRKQERTEEEIRRKIKRLQRQLAQVGETFEQHQESTPSWPPEDETNYWSAQGSPPQGLPSQVASESRAAPQAAHDSPQQELSPHDSPQHGLSPYGSPQHDVPRQGSPPQGSVPQSSLPPETTAEIEAELDSDILEILGDAPKSDTKKGPAIHKDVAARWQEVLSKGLTKDTKTKIMSEYLVPMNCERLIAPILNPEAKAALPEPAVKRDTSIMYKQNQIGVAMSALARVTDMVVSGETARHKILKPLSDACRILCDSHFAETRTRRNFVLGSINAGLRETLNEAGSEKYLFGENVGEKLKIAQNIKKSGEVLKQAKPKTNNNNYNRQTGSLNYRTTNQRKPPPARGQREPSRAAQAPATRAAPRASTSRRPSPPPPARRSYRK